MAESVSSLSSCAWVLASQVGEQLRGTLLEAEAETRVVVVYSTEDYRRLARHVVTATDEVVEVGSSLGKCTEILAARASQVLGVDVSLEQLAISRERVPSVSFVFLDLFEEAAKLPEQLRRHGVQRCSCAFLDIGGDRRCRQVLRGIQLLRDHLDLRLLAVKSEELYAAMAKWTGQKGINDGHRLSDVPGFLRCLDTSAPESAKAQLKKQKRARRVQALADNKALAEA
ncbi:unnamed protein product, partial [Cladocopium goreaui]